MLCQNYIAREYSSLQETCSHAVKSNMILSETMVYRLRTENKNLLQSFFFFAVVTCFWEHSLSLYEVGVIYQFHISLKHTYVLNN